MYIFSDESNLSAHETSLRNTSGTPFIAAPVSLLPHPDITDSYKPLTLLSTRRINHRPHP